MTWNVTARPGSDPVGNISIRLTPVLAFRVEIASTQSYCRRFSLSLHRLGMLHHQLNLGRAIVFIRIKPERHARAFAQGVGVAEPDGVETYAVLFQQQLQMALF